MKGKHVFDTSFLFPLPALFHCSPSFTEMCQLYFCLDQLPFMFTLIAFFLLGFVGLFGLFYLKGQQISRYTGIPWVSVLSLLSNNFHANIVELAEKQGPVLLQYVGVASVMICDVDLFKVIQKDEGTIFKELPATSPGILKLWDVNLVSSDGADYARLKRIIEPFFKAESLRNFSLKFNELSHALADVFAKTPGQEVDVGLWLTRFTVTTFICC